MGSTFSIVCCGASTFAAVASVKLAVMMFNLNYEAAHDIHELNERLARLETMVSTLSKKLTPPAKPESPISPLPISDTSSDANSLDNDWWCLFNHADQAHAKNK